jgi:excisionase family DNA binding protein
LRRKEFDPLEYIESAFREREAPSPKSADGNGAPLDVAIPLIGSYLKTEGRTTNGHADLELDRPKRFRKTELSAPRPRRAKGTAKTNGIDPELQEVWEALPRNLEFLFGFFDDSVTSNYYRGEFRESREELIRRLLDPRLTLEETSRLLGVCPATVRRYTNRKWLDHHRTQGGQRRFRLSDVVKFVEKHGRFPEE